MDKKLKDAKESLGGLTRLFHEVEDQLQRKRVKYDTMRRTFKYFDTYLAEKSASVQ